MTFERVCNCSCSISKLDVEHCKPDCIASAWSLVCVPSLINVPFLTSVPSLISVVSLIRVVSLITVPSPISVPSLISVPFLISIPSLISVPSLISATVSNSARPRVTKSKSTLRVFSQIITVIQKHFFPFSLP